MKAYESHQDFKPGRNENAINFELDNMVAFIEKATFLGLPTELRLRIYDFAIHADIDCTILTDIDHTADPRRGTQATLIPNPDAKFSRAVPWYNLKQTCKSVTSELHNFMTDISFRNDELNRTYILDLAIHNDWMSKPERALRWRHLPCYPTQAQFLVINVITLSGSGPWTEGGPGSLARAVFQILNHLCHNGPRILTKQQLPDHLQIWQLTINVERLGAATMSPAPGCNSDPRFNYALFIGGWEQISRSGHLHGFVENIKLQNHFEGERIMAVEHKSTPEMPGPWRNYGFYWGV